MALFHGHLDHEIVQPKIYGDEWKTVSTTTTLHLRKADFRLLRELVSKVPRETAFKGIGIQE